MFYMCHGLPRPGPGDWSQQEEGCRGPKSRVKRVLYLQKHVFIISSYKAALGSKKKLRKNKAKQIAIFKGPESIPYPEKEGHN